MMPQPMRPDEVPQIIDARTGLANDEAALAYYAELIGDATPFMWRELGFYAYGQ